MKTEKQQSTSTIDAGDEHFLEKLHHEHMQALEQFSDMLGAINDDLSAK